MWPAARAVPRELGRPRGPMAVLLAVLAAPALLPSAPVAALLSPARPRCCRCLGVRSQSFDFDDDEADVEYLGELEQQVRHT